MLFRSPSYQEGLFYASTILARLMGIVNQMSFSEGFLLASPPVLSKGEDD
jgi:hypothetical protein